MEEKKHKYTLSPAPDVVCHDNWTHPIPMFRLTYTKEFLDTLDERSFDLVLACSKDLSGGYVDSEEAHPDDFDDKSVLWNGAKVYDGSVVRDGAVVNGSEVAHRSTVSGKGALVVDSRVLSRSTVSGRVTLSSSSAVSSWLCPWKDLRVVFMNSQLDCCDVEASGIVTASELFLAKVHGVVFVDGSRLSRGAEIENSAVRNVRASKGCVIRGADVRDARLGERCRVEGTFEETAYKVGGSRVYRLGVRLDGPFQVADDGVVEKIQDVVLIQNFWSSGRQVTYTRSNDTWVTGCFRGSTEALLAAAEETDKALGGNRRLYVKAMVDFVKATGDIPASPAFEHSLMTARGEVITDRDHTRVFSDENEENER